MVKKVKLRIVFLLALVLSIILSVFLSCENKSIFPSLFINSLELGIGENAESYPLMFRIQATFSGAVINK